MPRGLHNWSPAQVLKFLKRHSFTHTHTRGSHFYYTAKQNGQDRQVCVPVHAGASIHPKTMKSIILQSGIAETEWKNYGK
jgi:predicted RNA binding protein YcfA (HicA-like mRNA interferase family)